MKWAIPHVAFSIDPGIERAVPGAANAIAAAAKGWSGVAGAPRLFVGVEDAPAPGYDGKNTVSLAKDGFAPAGDALAVTVLSIDESTGHIVDADIVLNGRYAFALFPEGSTPPEGARPVSTDARGGDSAGGDQGHDGHADPHARFDVHHVVAHELGHALGLGDEPSTQTALMYRYTWPEDATRLGPSGDDVEGLEALYVPPSSTSTKTTGCDAEVGGSPPAAGAIPILGAAFLGLVVLRRRTRRRTTFVAALTCAALAPTHVRAAPPGAAPSAVVRARFVVAAADTRNDGGLFRTELRLVTQVCREGACPSEVRVAMWGGHLDGITQRVGEDEPPREGDEVEASVIAPAPGL